MCAQISLENNQIEILHGGSGQPMRALTQSGESDFHWIGLNLENPSHCIGNIKISKILCVLEKRGKEGNLLFGAHAHALLINLIDLINLIKSNSIHFYLIQSKYSSHWNHFHFIKIVHQSHHSWAKLDQREVDQIQFYECNIDNVIKVETLLLNSQNFTILLTLWDDVIAETGGEIMQQKASLTNVIVFPQIKLSQFCCTSENATCNKFWRVG